MTSLEIEADVLWRVRRAAESAYPEECCGFLLGRRRSGGVRVTAERPEPNVAPAEERGRRFLVEPRALLRMVRRDRGRRRTEAGSDTPAAKRDGGTDELVGFYHSHPDHDARLSPTDLEYAGSWPRTVWLIVPVAGGEAGAERAWWIPARRAAREAAEAPGIPEIDGTADGPGARGRNAPPEPEEMEIRSPGAPGRTLTGRPRGRGGWR